MKKIFSFLQIMLIFSAFVIFQSCKDEYNPQIKSSQLHSLVVEGFINGNGVTSISLSRTRNITWADTASRVYEQGAIVSIVDQNNNTYKLTEKAGGVYEGNFVLDPSLRYKLYIRTSENKEYNSDFVQYKRSPAIDSLLWDFKGGGVQIYVNTHDAQNNTRYYRWRFDETWEFHSQYFTNLKYNPIDTSIIIRNDQVYVCWRSNISNNILIGSSAKLQQDIINKAPIFYIQPSDKRISVLYSINVTQYPIDSSGYNYWMAMKNNTENVGSIFDPQPNQTRGNIHNIKDTSEIVIGYINAGETAQKRMFIKNASMPSDWNPIPNCTEYNVPNIGKDTLYKYFSIINYAPITKDSTPGGSIKSYFSASASCVDCTLSGTNVKPPFWP